jgi:phosphoserine aminotransferase
MKKIYFTPGPAATFPTFQTHIRGALEEQIPSISHRSQTFKKIYQECYEGLKELLHLPTETAVFFTGSATEIWERLIQNCVEKKSFHCINGAFSKKFFETATQLQKEASFVQVQEGNGFECSTIDIPNDTELIAFTHNETSTGVIMPTQDIHQIADKNKDKIIAIDMVSSAPYPNFDFNKIDTAFFSVQKSFGLPAGLGVWICNEKCLEKAQKLEKSKINVGSYHRLTQFFKYFKTFETPATPNVLNIYLLNKVVQDMLKMGIQNIRKETDEKAKKIYDFLENHQNLQPFVKEKKYRSATVIVAEVKNGTSTPIINRLKEKNLIVGTGYGNFKEKHLRIANFVGTSMEEIEILIDNL